MPGLTSCSEELYVQNIVEEAEKEGYTCVVVNYRGSLPLTVRIHQCVNIYKQSPRTYCANSYSDLKEPLEYVYETYCKEQNVPLFVVGFSMGANIVGNLLAHYGKKSPITAACCVQPPMKLWITTKIIQKTFFGIYNKHLGKKFKQMLMMNMTVLKSFFLENHKINLEQILVNIKTICEMETSVIVPHFGFTSMEEYHQTASCANNLSKINTPTMFFMSNDDPIIGGEEGIAYKECMNNPYTLLAVTQYGGHLGYLESFFSRK